MEHHPLRVLFFLDYDDGLGGRFANSPGLLALIGDARRRGFDIRFLTGRDELIAQLDDPAIDVVAISSMERMLPRSVPVARQVRSLRPGIVLMLGGNSIDPFATDLVSSVFDIVVTGEGEHVFPALLYAVATALERSVPALPQPAANLPSQIRHIGTALPGGALRGPLFAAVLQASFPRRNTAIGISGVFVRDGESGDLWCTDPPPAHLDIQTTSAPLESELDPTCVFPWDIVEERAWEVFEFYTQRGCRWGLCEFCSIGNREIRALSHDKIIEVLTQATAHGVKTVSFSDDLFVQRTEWNRVLLERIVELDLGLEFRAQTMANRTVWPLLPLMRRAGFIELAFGMETLSPERARFMVKSYDGKSYVENGKETIARVAEAGISPVLYMILIDPRSTLLEAARELRDAIALLDSVYTRTGILPKLSFNPVMLPVTGPAITSRFPYSTCAVDLGTRHIDLPFEFNLAPPLALMVQRMAAHTDGLPYRRENLAILEHYLTAAAEAAAATGDSDLVEIHALRADGAERLGHLESCLNEEIHEVADSLLGRRREPLAAARLNFSRFGGYIEGLSLLSDLLTGEAKGA